MARYFDFFITGCVSLTFLLAAFGIGLGAVSLARSNNAELGGDCRRVGLYVDISTPSWEYNNQKTSYSTSWFDIPDDVVDECDAVVRYNGVLNEAIWNRTDFANGVYMHDVILVKDTFKVLADFRFSWPYDEQDPSGETLSSFVHSGDLSGTHATVKYCRGWPTLLQQIVKFCLAK